MASLVSPRHRSHVLSHLLLFLGVSALCGVLLAGLALPLVGAAGLVTKRATDGFESLPGDLVIQAPPQRSRLLDAEGHTIATFYSENRVSVSLAQVAPVMQQAIVAIEDSRFYSHGGIDLRGTARALVNNSSGDSVQGGSTLTQQYVKQVLLEQAVEKGDKPAQIAAVVRSGSAGKARKLREVRYAIGLEKRLSKDEILERYLNIAFFGSQTYGIEAAARHYFSTTAARLTLTQAATLAGMVQAPSQYNPLKHPAAALGRRNVVLQRMSELGYLTDPAVLAKAKAAKIGTKVSVVNNGCSTSSSPYFCDYVVQSILHDAKLGKTAAERKHRLDRGGLVVTTTLDPRIQSGAQRAVDVHIPRQDKSGIGTAISMVKPGDGAIVAMAENRTWGTTKARGVTTINFNVERAYGGSTYGFQSGSTFKPFTAAAAMMQGISPYTTVSSPYKKTFTDFTECGTGYKFGPYSPTNDSPSLPAHSDFETGLADSVNTWAVTIEQMTGLCKPAEVAEALGLTRGDSRPLQRVPSMTLGTNTITPLSMAGAYATFAARGSFCKPYAVVDIRTSAGTEVPHSRTACRNVLDQPVADEINKLLTGVISHGTGVNQNLGRPAAGKTGTTENNHDVWFDGYTPDLAAAVWVGDPSLTPRDIRNITINGRFYSVGFGGTIAGPIWKEAMLTALKNTSHTSFTEPGSDVTSANGDHTVPDVTGLPVDQALQALRDKGFLPTVSSFRVRSSEAAGDVAYTSPRSGSQSYQSNVRVYVSRGQSSSGSSNGNGGGGGTGGGGVGAPPAAGG